MSGRCNGVSNCADDSDEQGCDASTDIFVPAFLGMSSACLTDFNSDVYFQCANTNCIEKVGLCNGHDNCGDGSDEAHCSTSMTVTVESTSGNIITVETLQSHTGAYPFHDRSYHFDSLGDFTGKTFIKYSNDDKMTDHEHVMTKLRTTEPTTVYIVKQTTNGLPWLAQEGFERVAHTGVTFSGQRSTRHKEWDTSLLTTDSFDASEVFSKTFAAGTISLPGNGEGDGAFLTFMEKASAVAVSTYHLGQVRSNSCPSNNVDEANCLAAVHELLPAGAVFGRSHLISGNWGWVPPGCSVQTVSGWEAHYNTNSDGSNDGGYTPVCEAFMGHIQ